MLYSLSLLVLFFFCYSIVGYIAEVTKVSLREKKLILSRGYLIGPYLPIFGIGAILMVIFLEEYKNQVLTLFILSLTICCVLEYIVSYLMEKIFKLRWWDYTDRKFNINGRVCLSNGLMFGIGGVLIIRYLHPFLMKIFFSLSEKWIIYLGMTCLIILLVDFLFSTYIILQLKLDIDPDVKQDSTPTVRSEMKKTIQKYKKFYIRLLTAFPNILKYRNFLSFRYLKSLIQKKKNNK